MLSQVSINAQTIQSISFSRIQFSTLHSQIIRRIRSLMLEHFWLNEFFHDFLSLCIDNVMSYPISSYLFIIIFKKNFRQDQSIIVTRISRMNIKHKFFFHTLYITKVGYIVQY